MTHPADIPVEARVRRVMDQYLSECRDNGNRPSVLALATKLGLSITTFRRHFPELAKEISTLRTSPPVPTRTDARSNPYDVLVARNAKLRRANRSLTENLRFAAAQIQRLALDNTRLGSALEEATKVARLPERRR
ncbi:hypothetical protein ACIRVF_33730 [Kitasatospora sp. NPDC101157]|uniref:hypothetical protein n=1 Tax=Kitasatospora sp. NPDC101157 TaxID=3364098 RepID=UPI0038173CEB